MMSSMSVGHPYCHPSATAGLHLDVTAASSIFGNGASGIISSRPFPPPGFWASDLIAFHRLCSTASPRMDRKFSKLATDVSRGTHQTVCTPVRERSGCQNRSPESERIYWLTTRSQVRCSQSASVSGSKLPGLRMPCGSIACLSLRSSASPLSPRS